MAYFLGGAIVVWIIYVFFAIWFKHKIGVIITSIIFVSSSFTGIIYDGDFSGLISTILAIALICSIVPLQIRSKRKERWKQRRHKKKKSEDDTE